MHWPSKTKLSTEYLGQERTKFAFPKICEFHEWSHTCINKNRCYITVKFVAFLLHSDAHIRYTLASYYTDVPKCYTTIPQLSFHKVIDIYQHWSADHSLNQLTLFTKDSKIIDKKCSVRLRSDCSINRDVGSGGRIEHRPCASFCTSLYRRRSPC